jgi:beta-galactosidase
MIIMRVAVLAMSGALLASAERFLLDAGWRFQLGGGAPPEGPTCVDPRCEPATNDSAWRQLDLPHDFVLEGNFSKNADPSHG